MRSVSSAALGRAEDDVEAAADRPVASSVARSAGESGVGLTSSVPMPSGPSRPSSPRMLRTMAMCARGSATPRRCSAAVASAVMR